MYALILVAALGGIEPEVVTCSATDAAPVAEALTPKLQTGSLIFSKGDCLAVKVFTQSQFTHVAGVVFEGGEPIVYDSMNGIGTRRLTLVKWLETQRPDSLEICTPTESFTEARRSSFVESLEGQLGRPYSIKHHLTGRRADGLHCAEYMTDALCSAQLIRAKNPPRVSPASLREGVIESELYRPTTVVVWSTPETADVAPVAASWCEQLWIDTKVCTKNGCLRLRKLVLCR